MSLRSLLNNRANVQTKTSVSNGMGGFTETWANTFSHIPCSIQPKRGNEIIFTDADKVFANYTMYVEDKYTITEANRIVFGTKTFITKFVANTASKDRMLTIDLLQVI